MTPIIVCFSSRYLAALKSMPSLWWTTTLTLAHTRLQYRQRSHYAAVMLEHCSPCAFAALRAYLAVTCKSWLDAQRITMHTTTVLQLYSRRRAAGSSSDRGLLYRRTPDYGPSHIQARNYMQCRTMLLCDCCGAMRIRVAGSLQLSPFMSTWAGQLAV